MYICGAVWGSITHVCGLLLLSLPCTLLLVQLVHEKDHHISMLSREKEEERAALEKRIDGGCDRQRE